MPTNVIEKILDMAETYIGSFAPEERDEMSALLSTNHAFETGELVAVALAEPDEFLKGTESAVVQTVYRVSMAFKISCNGAFDWIDFQARVKSTNPKHLPLQFTYLSTLAFRIALDKRLDKHREFHSNCISTAVN